MLLILAGVTINLVLGQNGIIKRAQGTRVIEAIAEKREEVEFAIAEELMNQGMDKEKVTVEAVLTIIKKNYKNEKEKKSISSEALGEDENKFPAEIIYEPPASGIPKSIIIGVDENLNIMYAEVGDRGGLVAGTEIAGFVSELETEEIPESKYIKVGKTYVNSPDLSGFNPESTYYVGYDSSGGNEKVLGRIDRIGVSGNIIEAESGETSNVWYDYEKKIWANVVTLVGDEVTYWTWIPRYKYNPSGASASSVTTKFVNNANEYKNENGEIEELSDYEISESFTFGEETLSGYWMSKYETQNTSVDVMKSPVKDNKITIDTKNANGKYTIYVDGKKFKTGVSLPYTIDGVKTIKACDICLYSETSARMIGRTTRDTTSIEVDTSGFDKAHTYYITYDQNGENETIAGRMDKITAKDNYVGSGENNLWYDYGTKVWANAVTVTGENVTYWTYVPRYENVKGSNAMPLNTRFIPSTQKVADTGYEISEAFKFGDANLKGYWMSKYEIQNSSNGVEKVTIAEQTSNRVTVKTTLTDTNPDRTYQIYLNGSKYTKEAVKLPYTVNVKAEEEKSIMLYSVDDKRIIGETSVMPANIIQVDGSGFNTENTYYVLYDADGSNEREGGNIELDKNGNIKIPDTSQGTWYDYSKKIWANVVTKGKDENGKELITYLTYIPRYEYMEASTSTNVGVQFIPQSQTKADEGYKISEAFEFGGQQLKGYWMSKYEIQESTQQPQ